MAGVPRRRWGEVLRRAGLAALLCALHVQAACQDATVAQELLKEGFHRAALPVHGRYHRPAEESEDVLVVLKSPEVLICCCDNRLSAECWKPAEVEAPCSGKNVGPCRWYSVTHKPAYEESILHIPVGLRQHSSLVCVVTLLATVLCSSLVLAAVCKYGHFSPVTCSE